MASISCTGAPCTRKGISEAERRPRALILICETPPPPRSHPDALLVMGVSPQIQSMVFCPEGESFSLAVKCLCPVRPIPRYSFGAPWFPECPGAGASCPGKKTLRMLTGCSSLPGEVSGFREVFCHAFLIKEIIYVSKL